MLTILQFFFFMSLMRIGPEHAPKNSILVGLILAANLVVQMMYFMLNPSVVMTGLLAAGWTFVIIATSSLLLLGLLSAADYQDRFIRTFSSLQGCDIVLTLPRVGLLVVHDAFNTDGGLGGLLLLFNALIQIYALLVFGFILQRAFEVRLAAGVCIAILLGLLSAMSAAMFLPLPEFSDPELMRRLSEGGLLKSE